MTFDPSDLYIECSDFREVSACAMVVLLSLLFIHLLFVYAFVVVYPFVVVYAFVVVYPFVVVYCCVFLSKRRQATVVLPQASLWGSDTPATSSP